MSTMVSHFRYCTEISVMVMCVPLRVERAEAARKGKEKAMSTAGTIIRGEGEGERLWFAGGGLWTMKATAEETDEAFILIEDRMTRGKMTPLHTHPKQDETLIVLEGEILVYAEGRRAWDRPGPAPGRPPDTIEILGPPPFEAAREESASRTKA